MSRIAELEKRMEGHATEAPPPVQAPTPENFGLTPHEDRKGFIRRVREAIHGSTCRMKLELLVLNRVAELLRRGMARNLAEEQACKELGLFLALLEKRDIDTSTKQGTLFVEGNFPSFARMLDSTPTRSGREDSTCLAKSESTSGVSESDMPATQNEGSSICSLVSREPAGKIFPVGPYKLDMGIADLQGLVELSPIEYAALSRGIVFAGEKDFHVPPAKFLGYEWDIVIGVVSERIFKISPLLEFTDVATEYIAYSAIYDYCRQQLGKPTKRKGPLIIWDAAGGNVILERHRSAPVHYVALSLTSNAVG